MKLARIYRLCGVVALLSCVLGSAADDAAASEPGASHTACADTNPTGGAARVYLGMRPMSAHDSLATLELCIAPARVPLGSFHVAIDYDTNAATVVRALAAANGMQAVNANIPGTIEVAGVAPAGFASGLLTTIALRNRSRSEAVAFKLTLIELSTTAGDDVRRTALISGFPAGDPALGGVGPARRMADSARRLEAQASASAAAAPPEAPPTANKKTLIWIAPAPRVDSLAPSGARLAGDAVVEVVVHGGGFTFSGNVVVFGSTEIGPVPSANGTTLRFTVPTTLPSHGEVPPMRVSPGEFPVRIRNGNGESNAMTFTVRG